MSDAISRKAAIDMLLAMRGPVDVPRTQKAVWLDEGIDRCIEELRDMPAVQPAPEVETLVEALQEIAAEASVRVEVKKNGGISHKRLYEGWRKIATDRIDIARAALAAMEKR